jgi:prepilin-type N-terminal cleavage/methylation domain-containing protein
VRDARPDASRDGFTLVELLVVIVVLGIVATVVTFAVRGVTSAGENEACRADASALQAAAEAYYAQNGTYPESVDVLVEADFLVKESTRHQLDGGPLDYTITPVGDCAERTD